jgi:iron complex transport system permease protein
VNKKSLWFGILGVVSLLIVIYALQAGMASLSLSDLFSFWFGDASSLNETSLLSAKIFTNLRAPRIVMALIIGASLAISGAVLQGLFRNPLVDPGLIGISSMASMFAAFSIVFGVHELFSASWMGLFAQNLVTFIGASLAVVLAVLLSNRNGNLSIMTLLLVGIALNALGGAVTGLMTYLSDDDQLRNLIFWLMGSLGSASWIKVAVIGAINIPIVLYLFTKGKILDSFGLGEEDAHYIGTHVKREKMILIVAASLIVSTAVSISGIIGFVGLVVPHIVRLLMRKNATFLLLNSAWLGAVLLLFSDTLARTIVLPKELPIGIITSMIGTPIFLMMVLRNKNIVKS